MNNTIVREFSHKLIMEELEARQLFSDGIEGVVVQELPPQPATYIDIDSTTDSTAQSTTSPALQPNDSAIASNPAQDGVRQELVFVDTDVKNYQELLNDIYKQSDTERNIQVILLDNNSDGIQQITQALSQYSNLDAVHLISHGSDGSIDIGNSPLNIQSLINNQKAISTWGNSFNENGDILIYGCDVAKTQLGQNFIDYLSSLTSTDVAASNDATGNSSLGGDWTLEFSTGSIETAVALSATTQANWQGILATATFQDGVSGYTGTTDTYLDSTLSGTNYGASGTLQIITPLLLGSTQQSLISFDLSSIPAGSIVTSASVTFTASSAIAVLPSVDMYKMLSSWSESTSTWSRLGNGVSTDNSEASSTADASWGALLGLNGTATFSGASLASTAQSWINNPASNNGWLLTAGITSVQFYSSEEATIAYRPQLSITYTAPTPPSMDLDANNSSGATGSNYTTSFTEGGSAVKIADIDATVTAGSNSISPNLSGMTITISNLLDGSAESLTATTSGTSITASYNAGVLTLSGSDTAANYRTVLSTVTYNNTSSAPNTTSRVVNVVATDPYGGSSTAVSTTIAITAVNNAPTATNLSAAQSYTEDTPLALTGIVISDVDSANVTATLTLSDALAGSLNTGTSGAVTSTFAAGVWSASGAIANVNALLAGLTFTPALNVNSNLTIATSVSDGIAPAVTGSQALTGIAVNDAPTATLTLAGTTAQGQTLTASNSLADAVVAPPPPVINAAPLGMPPIFGDINTVVASVPVDIRQDSFNNTASTDSHDVNHLGIIRSGNENIFGTEAPLSNKTTLSAAIMTAPKGAVVIEANEQIVTASWTSEQPPFMVEQPGSNRLANNFKDLSASSTADYAVDMNRSFTQSEEQALWQHLAAMRNQIDDSEIRRNSLEISVAVISSVTLTAGFVRWVLRSGSLLASIFSSLSLLKRFDPLPIFIASKQSASFAKPENQEPSGDEIVQYKVERLFSRPTRHDNG
ncbi:MAG: DUF4347 domain-containing protein [Methylobacter sp.]